jgi:hypothetical protein
MAKTKTMNDTQGVGGMPANEGGGSEREVGSHPTGLGKKNIGFGLKKSDYVVSKEEMEYIKLLREAVKVPSKDDICWHKRVRGNLHIYIDGKGTRTFWCLDCDKEVRVVYEL